MRAEIRFHVIPPSFGDHFATPIWRETVDLHAVEARQPPRFFRRRPTDLRLR